MMISNIFSEAQVNQKYTQELRRDFHKNPELGLTEIRTSGIVEEELKSFGLEVKTGVGKTGVVGILKGNLLGPVILLRFDMDALPIQEDTGKEYASQTAGIMHACGHDAHVAIGLTAAKILSAHKADLKGTIKFVFQPGEEGQGGAELMIKDGVLESPKPDYALAMHVWNGQPVGWVGIGTGPMMAGAETFKVQLTGKGGHGAIPDLTIDPVVAAAQIISSLQTIVSRNVPPLDTAVVSVTSISSGKAFNVIPSSAELLGTIRTFDAGVRKIVLKRFEEIIKNVAAAFNCQAEISSNQITPPVVNDHKVAGKVIETFRKNFPEWTFDEKCQTMGSEDMAFMLERIPGCFFFVGSANPEKGLSHSHHHPKFDIDEEVLPRGVALICEAALNLLNS
jgi:amidohydrolase